MGSVLVLKMANRLVLYIRVEQLSDLIRVTRFAPLIHHLASMLDRTPYLDPATSWLALVRSAMKIVVVYLNTCDRLDVLSAMQHARPGATSKRVANLALSKSILQGLV